MKIKHIILLAIVLLNISCTAKYWHPVCRHRAIYAATTAGETAPTRIAYGIMPDNDFHAQAQVFIDGKWEWLTLGRDGDIWISDQDNFIVWQYWGIDEYFQKWFSGKQKWVRGCR